MTVAHIAPHAAVCALLAVAACLLLREGHRNRARPGHGRTRAHSQHVGTKQQDHDAIEGDPMTEQPTGRAMTMREIRDRLGHTTPKATCQPVRYEVSILPEGDINRHVFNIDVEYRGEGRWAVTRHGSCLGADGTWDFGVKEYDRGDVWLDDHRFCLDDALRLAREAAPHVVVNGHTALDAYRRTHPATEEPTR